MPPCRTGEERFRFLNDERPFTTWNDPERGRLWLYNLHYFDWLRQEEMTQEEGDRWIAKWISENPPPSGCGWEPYPLSLRIVNWIKWHMSGHPLSDEAKHSLAVQIRFLMRRLEYHLLANHLIANAKALVFAGCFFSGPEAGKWLAKGLEIYRRQLPEQILADGGHFERSPMYHSIILEDLLDLKNMDAPLELDGYIGRMLRWLAVMTGPDGRIALFNDAAFGIALATDRLFEYAEKLGFAPPPPVDAGVDLPASGYARLTDGTWTLICDGAPVGPDHQPGHAHADTLTFELWHDHLRLMVDSGTGEYIDTPLRREQRGTAGHNTVMIDGRNSSEVWGAHRVADRAGVVERVFRAPSFSAAHDGYRPALHRRSWQIADGKVKITDHITGKGNHLLETFWHFSPECEVAVERNRCRISCRHRLFFLDLPPNGTIELQNGHFSPEFGTSQTIPVVHWRIRTALPFEARYEIGTIDQ